MIKVNGSIISPTIFPDQTSQVWNIPDYFLEMSLVTVEWDFFSEAEFMYLAQLVTLLKSRNVRARLVLSYLPYARQDKEVTNETTFALHTFANLLNSLRFEEIVCLDPHSHVADTLIKNFTAEYPIFKVGQVIGLTETNVICYPDSGAQARYNNKYNFPAIYGEKVRNQKTGHIEKYELKLQNNDITNKNILIVDDICDGGATFIILAKSLLTAGVNSVNLFVTHGIFSKGLKPLKEAGISRVFTKDGEISEAHNQIVYRSL